MKKHSNKYTRIDAVNGDKISKKRGEIDNIKYYIPKKRYKLKKNEIGCLLSHIKAILRIEKDDLEFGMVIEDDINFHFKNRWDEHIEDIIKNAPVDWYIIKLHHSNYNYLNKMFVNL